MEEVASREVRPPAYAAIEQPHPSGMREATAEVIDTALASDVGALWEQLKQSLIQAAERGKTALKNKNLKMNWLGNLDSNQD